MADPKLDMFLVRDKRSEDGSGFTLWACRGPGKCTRKTSEKMRLNRLHQHCPDCIRPKLADTLADTLKKIERGDA